MSSSSDNFHNQLIAESGIDQATGFSRDGQVQRFRVIVDRCFRRPISGKKLLDYGCNVGDLLDFIWPNGMHLAHVNYTGVDLVPEFLERLRQKHQGAATILGSITDDAVFEQLKKEGPYDYVVGSGTFCYADQLPQHMEMLSRLWEITGDSLVVNFLSDMVAKERRTSKLIHCLYHPNFAPYLAGVLGCKCFVLYHDYRENDFTVALYRQFQP